MISKSNGEIVIKLVSPDTAALLQAQQDFAGVAEQLGLDSDEQVADLISSVRYSQSWSAMKVLVDSNILFSTVLRVDSLVARTLFYVQQYHQVYLTQQNLTELRQVVATKIPHLLPQMNKLLDNLSYIVLPTVPVSRQQIRDVSDQPILDAAINADIDVILTGDKDFLELGLEKPKCMNVHDFLQAEGVDAKKLLSIPQFFIVK